MTARAAALMASAASGWHRPHWAFLARVTASRRATCSLLGQLLPAGQDPLGGVEDAELVQRLAQQQRPGRIQLVAGHRLDQPAHHAEVVRVAGQVRAADQDRRVGPPPGVQPPHRDPQRRRTGDGGRGLQPVGLGQQDRPCPRPGHGSADHPGVQGMGQAHLLAGDGDRHQPGPFQRLQHRGGDGGLEIGEVQRLAQGQQLDDGTGLGRQLPDPLLDQVQQPGGARQPALQVPHPGPLDQRPGFQPAQHQFAHVQGVAPGDFPELPPGAGLQRAAQRQVQQGIEMSAAEVFQVDPLQPAVPPQAGHQVRDRLAGAHGGDQEDRTLRGQVPDKRKRGGIQQRHVVGDGHQAAAVVALVQRPAGLLEQRHLAGLPVGAGTAEPAGQQRGHGAQRHQRGGPAAGHTFGRVADRRRLLPTFVGQPGFPDSGPAVDHQARELARAQGPLEHLELRPAADDRPPRQRDRHTRQHDSPAPGQTTGDGGHPKRYHAPRGHDGRLEPGRDPGDAAGQAAGNAQLIAVAARWAAVHSKRATPMPRPRWLPAMPGPGSVRDRAAPGPGPSRRTPGRRMDADRLRRERENRSRAKRSLSWKLSSVRSSTATIHRAGRPAPEQ